MEIYNADLHLGQNLVVLDVMTYVYSIKDWSKAKPINTNLNWHQNEGELPTCTSRCKCLLFVQWKKKLGTYLVIWLVFFFSSLITNSLRFDWMILIINVVYFLWFLGTIENSVLLDVDLFFFSNDISNLLLFPNKIRNLLFFSNNIS